MPSLTTPQINLDAIARQRSTLPLDRWQSNPRVEALIDEVAAQLGDRSQTLCGCFAHPRIALAYVIELDARLHATVNLTAVADQPDFRKLLAGCSGWFAARDASKTTHYGQVNATRLLAMAGADDGDFYRDPVTARLIAEVATITARTETEVARHYRDELIVDPAVGVWAASYAHPQFAAGYLQRALARVEGRDESERFARLAQQHSKLRVY